MNISEESYKADSMVLENYINFSSELLRISLLVLTGYGVVIFKSLSPGDDLTIKEPNVLLLSMVFFALCSVSTLFHRFFASESFTYWISYVRKENSKDECVVFIKKKYIKTLKRAGTSLIVSEIFFGLGVLFFGVVCFLQVYC